MRLVPVMINNLENVIGSSPSSRSFHSMNYVNGKSWVYAGKSMDVLGDLRALEISDDERIWRAQKVEGICPDDRFSHSMLSFYDRYLVMFGGASCQVF